MNILHFSFEIKMSNISMTVFKSGVYFIEVVGLTGIAQKVSEPNLIYFFVEPKNRYGIPLAQFIIACCIG